MFGDNDGLRVAFAYWHGPDPTRPVPNRAEATRCDPTPPDPV